MGLLRRALSPCSTTKAVTQGHQNHDLLHMYGVVMLQAPQAVQQAPAESHHLPVQSMVTGMGAHMAPAQLVALVAPVAAAAVPPGEQRSMGLTVWASTLLAFMQW
jgi:hypothetical protein